MKIHAMTEWLARDDLDLQCKQSPDPMISLHRLTELKPYILLTSLHQQSQEEMFISYFVL
jgi:hypothetical protein